MAPSGSLIPLTSGVAGLAMRGLTPHKMALGRTAHSATDPPVRRQPDGRQPAAADAHSALTEDTGARVETRPLPAPRGRSRQGDPAGDTDVHGQARPLPHGRDQRVARITRVASPGRSQADPGNGRSRRAIFSLLVVFRPERPVRAGATDPSLCRNRKQPQMPAPHQNLKSRAEISSIALGLAL
jgi:hypothetical protein